MGSSASVEAQVHPAPSNIPPEPHPQPPITDSKPTTEVQQSSGVTATQDRFSLSQLDAILAKAFSDLNSTDVMAKIKYFDRVIEFILNWLPEAVKKGKTLFEAEKMVCDVLRKAEMAYPLAQFQRLECRIKNVAPQKKPDLARDLNPMTKQTITDRIKQLCLRSKANAYAFNKEMQIILEKEGGFKFKAGCKFSGIKSYLRIMTKIMEDSVSEELGSRQVYTDLNHYYWTPVFVYFNQLLDQHPEKVKIQLYDWMRCKVLYRNVRDLENAFERLSLKHKENIFRVKNRINEGTRDILINIVFKGEYTEVQLALDYDNLRYQFKHKLYELTREKLGVAFSCFTFTIHADDDQGYSPGLMTSQGYVKKCLLREKLEPGFVRLTQEQALFLKAQISKLVGKSDVIALKTGCLKGVSFGPDMICSKKYGPEINYMMVIKKKTTNFQENWLNWMD